jgi:cytochrome b561
VAPPPPACRLIRGTQRQRKPKAPRPASRTERCFVHVSPTAAVGWNLLVQCRLIPLDGAAMAGLAPEHAARGYTLTARVLHWVAAALVLLQIPGGLLIANFEMGPIYNLHKSAGILILGVMIVRLAWRVTHRAPPLPADIPATQRLAARAVHWTLYAFVIAQALIGWTATSAYPAPLPFFGLLEVPPIWWEDRALSDQLFTVHLWLGLGIAVLLAGHIGAALHHHFIRKDDVLMRMLRG